MEGSLQHKSLKKVIPKIYKRQWLEGVLYGWIRGQKSLVASVSVEQAVKSFYKEFDITEDDYPLKDCLTTYNRMNKELFESQKS